VGHLTETPGLYLRMRAVDYLEFFGELQGMKRVDRQTRSGELLKQFGLWDARGRRLGEFSKGMRQKIALIRAMLHNPRVLFLDEPTSGLDPYSAKQVRDAIETLRGSGHTIILCTHNLTEAETLADRLAVIRRGRLIALDTPGELKRRLLGPSSWIVRLARPLACPWPDLGAQVQAEESDTVSLRYRAESPEVTNPLLLRRLQEIDAQVVELAQVPRALEDIYFKLVQ
jgi:ABC-2 type transport system ATP-binding protein